MTREEALALLERVHVAPRELDAERERVAAAVDVLAREAAGAFALELANATGTLWFARGELAEGYAVLVRALAAEGADDPVTRARVLYTAGRYAFRRGDQDAARAHNEEALATARAAGDARGEADALVGLARVAFRDGDYARVRALAGEAREIARRSGEAAAESAPLHMLAAGTRLDGDYEGARALYTESLELFQRLGNDAGVGMEHHNLGWMELHLGDVDAAERHFAQIAPGGGAYADAWRDVNAAAVALLRGERDEGARLFAAGEATLAAGGIVPDPDDAFELDWMRAKLGE